MVPRLLVSPSEGISSDCSSSRFMCWSKPCRLPDGLSAFQLYQHNLVDACIQYFYCHINGHFLHLLVLIMKPYIKHSVVKLSILVCKSRLTLFYQIPYNLSEELLSVLLCCASWITPHSILCNLGKSALFCRKFVYSLYFLLTQALCY